MQLVEELMIVSFEFGHNLLKIEACSCVATVMLTPSLFHNP